jgi:hypothetical protein
MDIGAAMNTSTKRLLLLFCTTGAAANLTSCGLLIEGAVIAIRESREVPKGTPIEGTGFVVLCPGDNYYPVKNIPTAGGVTFRPTGTYADGDVYFVSPFHAAAKTPREALIEWNRRANKDVEVMRQEDSTFQGMPAVTVVVRSQQGRGGMVASMKVAGQDSNFIIIAKGDTYYLEEGCQNTIQLCERKRALLEICTTIKR